MKKNPSIADPDLDPEEMTEPTMNAETAIADKFTFLGEPLLEFDIRRQLAAQAMGNRLLSGTAKLPEGGGYDGIFVDVVALLYLCSHPDHETSAAVRYPDAVMDRALAWAADVGLGIGQPAMKEGCKIYGTIMKAVWAAQFRVVSEPKSARKNGGAGSKKA